MHEVELDQLNQEITPREAHEDTDWVDRQRLACRSNDRQEGQSNEHQAGQIHIMED